MKILVSLMDKGRFRARFYTLTLSQSPLLSPYLMTGKRCSYLVEFRSLRLTF